MAENKLVLNKIESLPIEDRYKEAMKELFDSEAQFGNQNGAKDVKVTRCLKIIVKGLSQ